MSIVILIAPTAATATAAWATLRQADLADAAPSRREQLTPQQVQQLMLKTVQQRRNTTAPQTAHTTPQGPQIVLEKIWTELATDLVLGNVDHAQFGWCQTLDDHTPAFWQRFDPETRFVLVYEDPIVYAAGVIAQDHSQAQDLQATLQQWHTQHSQLLNTFYVLGVDALLVHASQIHSAAVELGLHASGELCQTVTHAEPENQVLTQLLQPMVVANTQVQTLWQELQAAAQVPWQELLTPLQAVHLAIVHYLQQQLALEKVQKQRDQLIFIQQQFKNELTAERRAYQNELLERRATKKQSNAHKQEMDQLSQQRNEAHKGDELLLVQLHNLQGELERFALFNDAQKKEIVQLRQSEATLQSRVEDEIQLRQAEEKAKLNAIAQFADLTQEKYHLSQQLSDIKEEGELMLVQFQHMKEELEFFYYKDQDQRKQIQPVVDFWRQHPPAEVWVDMRRTPDGRGWYGAESDGRWSGPDTESTLYFPALVAGQYLIELQIADAMAPEMVASLQLCAQMEDGQAQLVELVHEFGPADHIYPMVSTGLLRLPAMQSGWQLHMKMPCVISPAQYGGTDNRHLGLRLQGVRLSLQQADK